MRRIADYSLWLGHRADGRDLPRLHENGIRAVVDLAWDELPLALPRDLTYCRFPLVDGTGNPASLLRIAIDAIASLVREDIATLVCCGNGVSRSPCVAAAAIVRVGNIPLPEGIELIVASGRSDVTPGLWSDVQAAFARG